MEKKSSLIVMQILYCIALVIVVSWLFLSSFDLEELKKVGIQKKTVASLPELIQPLYDNLPNIFTLLCYLIFTFSAFIFIQKKEKMDKLIGVSSFVFIFFIMYLLK